MELLDDLVVLGFDAVLLGTVGDDKSLLLTEEPSNILDNAVE